jgi:hypothetical protein
MNTQFAQGNARIKGGNTHPATWKSSHRSLRRRLKMPFFSLEIERFLLKKTNLRWV